LTPLGRASRGISHLRHGWAFLIRHGGLVTAASSLQNIREVDHLIRRRGGLSIPGITPCSEVGGPGDSRSWDSGAGVSPVPVIFVSSAIH
ncbi:MAG: hypothetical protein ACLSHA_11870, partial [Neglectibacter timonensis]